jgi:hypothetical protein
LPREESGDGVDADGQILCEAVVSAMVNSDDFGAK